MPFQWPCRFAIFAALLCAVSSAQQPAPLPVYHVTPGIDPPIAIHKVQPEYSDEARAARLQGSVMVYALVGEDGHTHDLRVLRSLGLGLDEKALAAASNWHFVPASKDGQPVAMECTIEIDFHLDVDLHSLSLSRLTFSPQPGVQQPVLLQAQYRPILGLPDTAAFRVSFDVDLDGNPANVQVYESSDPKYNDEVIALIREWRFQAALNSGSAFQAHGFIDLGHGLPLPEAAPHAAPVAIFINGDGRQEIRINGVGIAVEVKPPAKKREQ